MVFATGLPAEFVRSPGCKGSGSRIPAGVLVLVGKVPSNSRALLGAPDYDASRSLRGRDKHSDERQENTQRLQLFPYFRLSQTYELIRRASNKMRECKRRACGEGRGGSACRHES